MKKLGIVLATLLILAFVIGSVGCNDGQITPTLEPTARGTPIEAWVVSYRDLDTGKDDIAKFIAVDNIGNVYVTGYRSGADSDYSVLTVKYDGDGNQLWSTRYDDPLNMDTPVELVVDNLGNAYVLVDSGVAEKPWVIIKYDSNGKQQWLAHFGNNSILSEPKALAVDGLGNVYVTGEDYYNQTSDYTTIKYDSNGNQLWIRHYNGPANDTDVPSAMAIDSTGNVYITGNSKGVDSGDDYATIKYNPEGNMLWMSRYNGLANAGDGGNAIVLDNFDNVYVTGNAIESYTASTMQVECTTIKYDRDGNQLWVEEYYGLGEDIVFDGLGSVYVVCRTYGVGYQHNYVTIIKYSISGDRVWVQKCDDFMDHIALDMAGNIYIAGGTTSGISGPSDWAIAKYNAQGGKVWLVLYDSPVKAEDRVEDNRAEDIYVDDSGNIYVTGYNMGIESSEDYTTIKYVQ